jgi:carboxymethylenebutenolidase
MAPRDKPERMKADEFPREVLDLFDHYVHGRIDRRGFLDGAARFAVGGMSAAIMLEKLRPHYEWARHVPPGDPRIRDEYVEYASPQGHGTVRGLLVKPTGTPGPWPAVLVIHENRGLNPYIEDVVRRMGAAGFLALGPDALTSLGGYPGNDEEGVAMQRELDGAKIREDFVASAEYLMSHPESTGKVGAVGFCFGGGVVGMLAVRLPNLAAGVPFYGTAPSPDDVHAINAPLLVNLAENDERINAGWPATEEALRAHGKQVTVHVYPGTNHGFHNDTTPRYDATAGPLAQQRTIDFFNQHLRG